MKTEVAVPKKGGAVAKWDEEMARYAKEASDAEQMPGVKRISFRNGVITVNGQEVEDNKMEVVVIDSVYVNTYYVGSFDSDKPQSPVCFALGRNDKELKPHEASGKPQHEQCLGCAKNAFGTADKGKGKACKNIRRLMVISADRLNEKSIAESEVYCAEIPVTSVRGWAEYVRSLAGTVNRAPFAVVTNIGVLKDKKDQFHVTFQLKEVMDQKLARASLKRREAVMETSLFPYGTNTGEETEEKPKKENGKQRRKF